MKAIVFGGSGFVGSHVVDVLFEQGYDVVIFDKRPSPYLRDGMKMVVGDILDEEAVCDTVNGADYVYNFAGIADLDAATASPIASIELNIRGTCNILEACVRYGVKRLIFASSFYVNSDKGGFYRCSKQAAEIYIEEYNRRYGQAYTVLRYGSLYGQRSDESNGVHRMLKSALEHGKIHFRGTGNETREYIDVLDAAELSVQILDKKYENKYITLTGHNIFQVRNLFLIIQEIIGKDIDIIYEEADSNIHYDMTPYTFKPQCSLKLVGECYRDIGQGLTECLREIQSDMYNSRNGG